MLELASSDVNLAAAITFFISTSGWKFVKDELKLKTVKMIFFQIMESIKQPDVVHLVDVDMLSSQRVSQVILE